MELIVNDNMLSELGKKFMALKSASGTHSPSMLTILEKIPDLKIKVDACFLSNPYATDLFLEYFNNELLKSKKISRVLEFYPSQNSVIADLLGEHLGINPKKIFVCNGAIEAIQAVMHQFVKGKVVINIPTFSSYYEFINKDSEAVFYTLEKENTFILDPEDYISFVRKIKPNSIVIINPNNPDGGYIKYQDLKRIVEELHGIVENIIVDESFIHFAFENSDLELKSIIQLTDEVSNLIIIKSMSKDFGIAGIRAGYAVMDEEKVEQLTSNGYLWNLNGLAEYFFRLYTRPDFRNKYEEIRKKYIIETLIFISELNKIRNIRVYPTKANFVLIEILDGRTAEEITNTLLIKYGIYVRNCSDKKGLKGQFIRLAARSASENDQVLLTFRDLFE
ncbi:MAG: histidinol-phosphate aminotransferase family protein [Chitinophagaceae bacterium]|nr:histidinol-phosphate aminotransferase family protein [Chitinophagaceae bacterium]